MANPFDKYDTAEEEVSQDYGVLGSPGTGYRNPFDKYDDPDAVGVDRSVYDPAPPAIDTGVPPDQMSMLRSRSEDTGEQNLHAWERTKSIGRQIGYSWGETIGGARRAYGELMDSDAARRFLGQEETPEEFSARMIELERTKPETAKAVVRYRELEREHLAKEAEKGQQIAQIFRELQEYESKLLPYDKTTLRGYAEWLVGQGITTLGGDIAPVVVVSVLTRSPNLGLSVMASRGASLKYHESREKGRTPEQAALDGFVFGLAEAVPERLPLGLALKAGQKFWTKVGKVSLSEAGTEMITEVIQLGYDAGILKEEMTLVEALIAIGEAGLLGAFVGSGMAVITPTPREEKPKPTPEVEKALIEMREWVDQGPLPGVTTSPGATAQPYAYEGAVPVAPGELSRAIPGQVEPEGAAQARAGTYPQGVPYQPTEPERAPLTLAPTEEELIAQRDDLRGSIQRLNESIVEEQGIALGVPGEPGERSVRELTEERNVLLDLLDDVEARIAAAQQPTPARDYLGPEAPAARLESDQAAELRAGTYPQGVPLRRPERAEPTLVPKGEETPAPVPPIEERIPGPVVPQPLETTLEGEEAAARRAGTYEEGVPYRAPERAGEPLTLAEPGTEPTQAPPRDYLGPEAPEAALEGEEAAARRAGTYEGGVPYRAPAREELALVPKGEEIPAPVPPTEERVPGPVAPQPLEAELEPLGTARRPATDVATAQARAATSPENDIPEPTPAQVKAGNYQKGHLRLNGLDISIENPAGSMRSGVSRTGRRWSQTLKHAYGYIRGIVGKDKGQIDVFLGPKAESTAAKVYVVDQVTQDGKKFDEHKVLIGFEDVTAARTAYLENYPKGWKGLGAITEMSLDDFKRWAANPENTRQPVAPSWREVPRETTKEPTSVPLSREPEAEIRQPETEIRQPVAGQERNTEDELPTPQETPLSLEPLPTRERPQWMEVLSPSTGRRGGLSVAEVEAIVRKRMRGWGSAAPEVRVFATAEEARIATGAPPHENYSTVGGVTYGPNYSKVALIAENMRSAKHVRRVLAHEAIGHSSFIQRLRQLDGGQAIANFTAKLQKLKGSNARIDRIVERLRREEPSIYDRRTGEVVKPEREALEIVARLSEERVDAGALANLVREFRELVRRVLNAMGLGGEFSDVDIDLMLSAAARRLRTNAPAPEAQAPATIEGDQQAELFARTTKKKAKKKGKRKARKAEEEPVGRRAWRKENYRLDDLDAMPAEIREVVEREIDQVERPARLRRNLRKMKGTEWHVQAVDQALARAAVKEMIAGREPTWYSALSSSKRLPDILRGGGMEGLWSYLIADKFIGHPTKPELSVNGSHLSCNPSPNCAIYCYATKGNYYYEENILKGELVHLAVTSDPVRAAKAIATQYAPMLKVNPNRALRLFDKGDGTKEWIPLIKELNKQAIRVHVFSKKPEFLRKVPAMNVRLLSTDATNVEVARKNKDLPVAWVYTGTHEIPMLESLQANGNEIQLILPVQSLKGSVREGGESWREIPVEIRGGEKNLKVCPIDGDPVKMERGWRCVHCDRSADGIACYHGQRTEVFLDLERRMAGMEPKLSDAKLEEKIRGILDEPNVHESIRERLRQGLSALADEVRGARDPAAVARERGSILGSEPADRERPAKAAGVREEGPSVEGEEDLGPLYSRAAGDRPVPGFYSHLRNEVEARFPTKGTGVSYAQTLETLVKKHGVKREEVEWLNLDEELRSIGPKRMTREQVLDYIDKNQVELVERELSAESYNKWSLKGSHGRRAILIKLPKARPKRTPRMTMKPDLDNVLTLRFSNRPDKSLKGFSTETPGLVVAYNPVHKEATLTHIESGLAFGRFEYGEGSGIGANDAIKKAKHLAELVGNIGVDWTLSKDELMAKFNAGDDGIRDAKDLKQETEELWREDLERGRQTEPVNFEHDHWKDDRNIIGWARVADFTDVDGRRVLLVDEVQSDWHQQGRDLSYRDSRETKQFLAAYARLMAGKATPEDFEMMDKVARKYTPKMHLARFGEYWTNDDVAQMFGGVTKKGASPVPNAPFKTSWDMLVMKRMLRYAAMHNYDRIALSTGVQQNVRYGVEQYHYDRIEWKRGTRTPWGSGDNIEVTLQLMPRPSDPTSQGVTTSNVFAVNPSSRRVLKARSGEKQFEGRLADDVFGKEVADKILSQTEGMHDYGKERIVGGEALKSFYDRNLVQKMNKHLKRWGVSGEKGMIESLKTRPLTPGVVTSTTRGMHKVWLFDITDDMRASVTTEGQRLFSRAPATDTPEFKRWFRDSKVVDESGEPLVMYHGTSQSFTEFAEEGADRGGLIAFFTSSPKFGSDYAERMEGSNVMPVYLRVENPFDFRKEAFMAEEFYDDTGGISDPIEARRMLVGDIFDESVQAEDLTKEKFAELVRKGSWDAIEAPEFVEWLREGGYDGVITEEAGAINYGVFDRIQVKSAVGNVGTYDPTNPNILYSRDESEGKPEIDERDPPYVRRLKERERKTKPSSPPPPPPEGPSAGRAPPPRLPRPPTSFSEENARIREEDRTVWMKARSYLRRMFAPGGNLPENVFKEKIARDSQFSVVEFWAKNLVGNLERAVKRDYGQRMGSKLDPLVERTLSEALAGRVDPSIPEATRTAVVAMRKYIDGLSREYSSILEQQIQDLLAEAEAASGPKAAGLKATAKARAELLAIINGNVGTYVHRSYKAFDDPRWFSRIPDEVIDRARDYLVNRYMELGAGYTEAVSDARVTIERIVKTDTAYDSLEAFIAESKLGAKDLTVLKKRKNIAPEIRALLGEHTDPRLNFAKSVTKMGRLIYNQRFLDAVRESGLGVFLFEGKDAPMGAVKRIAAEGSDVMAPLNGLWTFPEVEQAFVDALGKEQMANWYRIWVRLNGLVKYGKTVLSPVTAMRNWQSAFFFAVANGHWDLRHARKSITAWREYFAHKGSKEKLAYLARLKELGVVYDTPHAGEMIRLLEDSHAEDWLTGTWVEQPLKSVTNIATKFYQFGDDFWKIIGFENEKQTLMKYAGMSETEAEIEAAERVRNTYPTYSMVGRAVQSLRRLPILGTFVSFPAEIIRTSGHMLRYTAHDLRTPGMRVVGLRRLAGLSIAAGGAYAAQELMKAALGFDDEEEEAMRLMMAPWNRNSNIMILGREPDGTLRYIDLSFIDPYNYWKRPITAMMRGLPWEQAAAEAAKEALEPFLGTDIGFRAFIDIFTNQRESGGRVYRPHDLPAEQTKAIGKHFATQVQPGFSSQVLRTLRALDGYVSKSGRKYKLKDELWAWMGWRVSSLDPVVSLHYRSYEFQDAKRDATSITNEAIRNPNRVDVDEMRNAYHRSVEIRRRAYRDMAHVVHAARLAGLDNPEIRTVLRNSNISEADTGALLRGEMPRWAPSTASEKRADKRAAILFDPEVRTEMRQRYRTVREFARELPQRERVLGN